MSTISSFSGTFRWLSNFEPASVKLDGISYTTVEHAYQAAKTFDDGDRAEIRRASSPGKAKRLGYAVKLRPDWENVKFDIMLELVRQKFTTHTELKEALLGTAGVLLREGNTWHDNFYGSCSCPRCGDRGLNNLGKILMLVRDELSAPHSS